MNDITKVCPRCKACFETPEGLYQHFVDSPDCKQTFHAPAEIAAKVPASLAYSKPMQPPSAQELNGRQDEVVKKPLPSSQSQSKNYMAIKKTTFCAALAFTALLSISMTVIGSYLFLKVHSVRNETQPSQSHSLNMPSSRSSSPTEKDGKQAIEQYLMECKSPLLLLNYRKTNSKIGRDVSGVEQFIMEGEGEVECTAGGFWGAAKVMRRNPNTESGPGIPDWNVQKGQCVKISVEIYFDKTEKGWLQSDVWIFKAKN